MSVEFRHIVRVVGTDLDGTKKLAYGLTKIKGLGIRIANAIVKASGLDPEIRIGNLSDNDISKLEAVIKEPSKHGVPAWLLNRRRFTETGEDLHLTGPDLTLSARSDIDFMVKIRSWKGTRHSLGLKVRGQKTRTTARTGRAVGIKREKLLKLAREKEAENAGK